MSLMELVTDPYNRRARLQPALIAIVPVLVVGLLLYPEIEAHAVTIVTILAYFGGSIWLTQIGRERGKRIEPLLFKAWGGKPSVAVIRHRDGRLNPATKARYHDFLAKNVPHFKLPPPEAEEQDPDAADTMYQTATDWLLSKTRVAKMFRLIFEENMNYGFRRNLYALKPFSLILDVLLLIVLIGVTFARETVFPGDVFRTFKEIDGYIYAAFSVVLLHAIGITMLVTKDWVKTTADAFGLQLLAACDILPSSGK